MRFEFSEMNPGFSFVRLQVLMVETLAKDGLDSGAMPEYKIKEMMELKMKSLMQKGIIDGSRPSRLDIETCIFWYPSN